jgi:hypothetical protein
MRLETMKKLALYSCFCLLLTTTEAFQVMPPRHAAILRTTTTSTTGTTSATTTTTALNMVGFLRRFRNKGKAAVIEQTREIGIGASLPEVDVEVLNTDEDGKVFTEIKTVGELLAGTNKAIVLGK